MKFSLLKLLSLLLSMLVLPLTSPAQSTQNQLVPFSPRVSAPGYLFKKWAHPEMFQGKQKRKKYFEGWYYKMVSKDASSIMSIIPGISLSRDKKHQHAFVQIIDGVTAETKYFTFPIEKFFYSQEKLFIKIGENYFSTDSLYINLKNEEDHLTGSILSTGLSAWPDKKIMDAGIMGWYRFVPLMECYHGVVSMDHQLHGCLTINHKKVDFSGGRGYIEKDWGRSMPAAWIWMQSNHFSDPGHSFMLSVANIPWLGNSFTGFLGFFLHHGKLHRFATYTRAKLELNDQKDHHVSIVITDRKYKYTISAQRQDAGLLKAPLQGSMDRRISESINARLHLIVQERMGSVIFNDSTTVAGLEIVGDQLLLRKKLKKKSIDP